MLKFVFLVLLLTVAFMVVSGSAEAASGKNPVINGGFESGLSGWDVQGEAAVETAPLMGGTHCLRLGPGSAAVSQRCVLGGLRIGGFGATVKTDSPATVAAVRVRCYDSQDHFLMEIKQLSDAKCAEPKGNWVGTYFKTQANTAYVVVSIEKESAAPGTVYAEWAQLADYDPGPATHAPLCNLHQYMHPIWQGKTVYNETVLLESEDGKPASGKMLFTPDQIISVQDYSLSTTYASGKDYTLTGKTMTCTPATRMPTVKETDFPVGNNQWFGLDGKHIVVTYTHSDAWKGPVPRYQGAEMPHTMNILRHRLPLSVIAYGDSITLGDNVSGYMQIPPYMPTWAELFVSHLTQAFGDSKITLANTALGGATSAWGLQYANSAVATLNPDLVIIAFGMNDCWSVSPEDFRQHISGIIKSIRARRPHAEFMLIASMRFDPAYSSKPADTVRMAGYTTALRSLTGTGVCLLDMNAISGTLFAAKKPKDLISNPLHPNDFLARWYAQGLAALLTPPEQEGRQ